MIRLQCFALLVLAGLTQVYSNKTDVPFEFHSFPYYPLPNDPTQDDLYTSSIVSYKSGPLCSGFHIKQNLVITAASCVHRDTAETLFVMSHTKLNSLGSSLVFLEVQEIITHKKFDLKTQEHDLAALIIKNNHTEVPVLNYRVDALQEAPQKPGIKSALYIAKYTFSDDSKKYYTKYYLVDSNTNIKRCTNDTHVNGFVCVSLANHEPYSYGVADIGTPLIYRTPRGDIVRGMFSFRVYNMFRVGYLYQSFDANMDFLIFITQTPPK